MKNPYILSLGWTVGNWQKLRQYRHNGHAAIDYEMSLKKKYHEWKIEKSKIENHMGKNKTVAIVKIIDKEKK